MIDYENFHIRTLKTMYRIHNENLEILKNKLKQAQTNYDEEIIILQNIEKALKRKGVLKNQIDIEEILQNDLTNVEN